MGKVSLLLMALAAVAAGSPILDRRADQASCSDQSCSLARLSGSTGLSFPDVNPSGGTKSGNKCIASYPGTKFAKTGVPAITTRDESAVQVAPRAACKENIFIFARGTTEIGTMGESVGPIMKSKLSAAMPGKWAFQGVDYEASFAGDECLGLPGGAVATTDINQAATSCPDQKIWVSGYSEGAMVAHNGVAHATADAKKKIAVSTYTHATRPLLMFS
jgi:Cutinase